MTDQITVPRATWDAMREANVQWIDAYAKLRMERDSLKKEAELGNIAMRFVDRAGDVADCDPAERICSEFHEAMSDAVDRLYVQPRSALTAANAVSVEPCKHCGAIHAKGMNTLCDDGEPLALDESEIEDLARSAFESAMAFGVDLNSYTKLAKHVWEKMRAHPQATEPAGYKLVPVEPTPEMIAAIWAYKSESLQDCYRALLAAAPEAKQ